uniref:Uncharacterized protein n=1 Tax=Rhizophora mucronata TaxID=61149 RepID=A0A2P2IVH8_RHIMU
MYNESKFLLQRQQSKHDSTSQHSSVICLDERIQPLELLSFIKLLYNCYEQINSYPPFGKRKCLAIRIPK